MSTANPPLPADRPHFRATALHRPITLGLMPDMSSPEKLTAIFRSLFDYLVAPGHLATDSTNKDGPCFCCAVFSVPYRELKNVTANSALVYDLDYSRVNGRITREEADALVDRLVAANVAFVLYSSWSCCAETSKARRARLAKSPVPAEPPLDPDNGSYRLVIAVSRDILRAEYAHVNKNVKARFGIGALSGNSDTDCSHLWFPPRHPVTTPADMTDIFWHDGVAIDVDAILALPVVVTKLAAPVDMALVEKEEAKSIAIGEWVAEDPVRLAHYTAECRAALLGMQASIFDGGWEGGPPDPEGVSGSVRLLAACRRVKLYGLPPIVCRDLVDEYNERSQPQWEPADVEHKLQDADAQYGAIVERDYDKAMLDRLRRRLVTTTLVPVLATTPPVDLRKAVQQLRNRLKQKNKPNRHNVLLWLALDNALARRPLVMPEEVAERAAFAITDVAFYLGIALPITVPAEEVSAFLQPSTRALVDTQAECAEVEEYIRNSFAEGRAKAIDKLSGAQTRFERLTGVRYE